MQNERDAVEVVQGDVFQHVKRGTHYIVVGSARLQASGPLPDEAEVVVYQGNDGKLWVREIGEFLDGRFAHLGTRPPAPEDAGTVERETYRQMHDIATNDLGCASILEALEKIDRFRKALTTIADGVLDARGNKRPLLAKFSQTLALAALSRLDREG